MRFYKLRVTTNAANIATTFNEQFTPETIPETNDPFRVDWVNSANDEYIVGEKVGVSRAKVAFLLTQAMFYLGPQTLEPTRGRLHSPMADIRRQLQHTGLSFKSAYSHRP